MNGNLDKKLKELASEGKSIHIGLAGLGQMGRSLLSQIRDLEGMEISVLADIDTEATLDTFRHLGMGPDDYCYIETGTVSRKQKTVEGIDIETEELSGDTVKKMAEAFSQGLMVYSSSLSLLFAAPGIDVIVDATGSPNTGAYIALNAITSKKHLITFNVEMDVTIGPFLTELSRKYGVIYSLSAGDEPPAAKELYDFASMLGMGVVAAGKGKNNPLDREANPEKIAGYAKEKGSNPYMMTSFIDGTKSMVEMACLSNATGLVPDCRGMHAVKADISGLLDKVKLKSQGGILEKSGVVEFVIGDLAPGVFLIYTTENNIIKEELKYLLFGDGPNYLLYRPYHLTSIETPISIARAYFEKEPTMVPKGGLVSDVVTIAKKDLKKGDKIDRMGGFTTYGLIDTAGAARDGNLLPVGLSQGAVLQRDMEKDSAIAYSDVELPRDLLIHRVRKIQDSRYG